MSNLMDIYGAQTLTNLIKISRRDEVKIKIVKTSHRDEVKKILFMVKRKNKHKSPNI